MKMIARFALVAAMAASVALAASPAAQPPGEAKAEDKTPEVRAVEMIADAYQLMDIAKEKKLPEVYVGAGRLFLLLDEANKDKKLDPVKSKVEVQTEDGKPVAGAKTEGKPTRSFAKLADDCFTDARSLANEQKRGDEINKLIASIKANPLPVGTREAIGGPKLINQTIGAKQTHTHTIDFNSQKPGAIGFQAAAPLRCKMAYETYVHFDQVVRVGSYSWQPGKDTGAVRRYVITVHNHTNNPVEYKLFTN